MKAKTLTKILITTVASAGLLQAAEDDAPKPERPEPGGGDRPVPQAVIDKYDADGDGKLNEEERAEARKNRPDGGKGKGKGGGEGEGDRPQRPAGGAGAMFERADKNSDGKLTEDEVPAEAWARLSKADKDGDGAVSKEEIGGARPQGGDRPAGGGDRLAQMDTNGDGNLSKDEIPERAWQFMSRADKDGDEVLSKAELEAMRAEFGQRGGARPGGDRPGGGGDMFATLDKNSDGKLSEDEVPERIWTRLSNADKDADGAISKEEMDAIRAAAGGAGRGEGGGDDKPKRPTIETTES